MPATITPRRTSPTALRPLSTALGTLARADASASFAFGALEVIASLTGPSEVRLRDELTDRATLDIYFQPQHGVSGIPAKSLRPQTTATKEQRNRHPLLLGPDQPPSVAEKAALINAASLALLDGGIPAKGTVAACSCAILPAPLGTVLRENSHLNDISASQLADLVRQRRAEDGDLNDEDMETNPSGQQYTGDTIVLLDPTPLELAHSLSTHVFAFSFSGEQIDNESSTLDSEQILADSQGAIDFQDWKRARQLCLDASRNILGFMREAIQNRVLAQAA